MGLLDLQAWQMVVLFLPAIFNLWGIWHAQAHEFATPLERMLWLLLCVFVPFIGGLAYLIFGYRRAGKRQ